MLSASAGVAAQGTLGRSSGIARPTRVVAVALAALAWVGAGACGRGEDRPGQITSENNERSGSAPAAADGSDGYVPRSTSDEAAGAARDVAAMARLLSVAERGPIDWDAVRSIWSDGGRSRGEAQPVGLRALADEALARRIDDAIAGTGAAAATEADRARQVGAGLDVVVARKVLGELAAAERKAAAGDVATRTGAPRHVDTAWAFFTTVGDRAAAVSGSRAPLVRYGPLRERIVAGLGRAQQAAGRGSVATLGAAVDDVDEAVHRAFHLAIVEHLGAVGDESARTTASTRYLALEPRVRAADPDAAAAIDAAFARGDTAAARAALHRPAVLAALGTT